MINRMKIQDLVEGIEPLNEDIMWAAQERLNNLVKPPESLGELESYVIRLSGITRRMIFDISRRAILIFCADNGVCVEGIGSAPQSVTHAQTINFVRGVTGVAVLARAFRAKLIVVDVGVNERVIYPGVRDLRVRVGTGNIRVEDAMTREEAVTAIERGAQLAQEMAVRGYQLIGVGEMGIGNTTTSTAVLSALTGVDSSMIVGIGGGIGHERLLKKRQVIQDALKRAQPDPTDVVGVLAKVGGLDLCAMAGAYLGAAAARLPVVIDGYIGCVAALAAVRLAPMVQPYLFASHISQEPGAVLALSEIGLSAPLHLRLRLGEGSGCPMMFGILDAACAVFSGMATFEEAGIDPDYMEEVQQ